MSGRLTMSEKERITLTVLHEHLCGILTAAEAAEKLTISVRQFYRIKCRFLEEGDEGLLHRARKHRSRRPVVRRSVRTP
jgi:hypothetical protein